jgi:glycosyltransferase involved in cell wall biosynthesis
MISKFIALSPYAKKQLVASGIPENLVRIKPNFTNRLLTPKNGFAKSIIYAGRLENEKGLELLLKAWTDSNAGESGWTLKIAGSGSLRTKVEFYATQFREVQFLGYLSKPELTNEIAESSFSIFTSQMLESCPMQVIESLAVGTPVIYKPNESISDFMNTSYSIKLPENPEDWYLLFNKLNQMVPYEMSKASYIKYEQEFSPEVSLASLESIYLDAQALPNKS